MEVEEAPGLPRAGWRNGLKRVTGKKWRTGIYRFGLQGHQKAEREIYLSHHLKILSLTVDFIPLQVHIGQRGEGEGGRKGWLLSSGKLDGKEKK